MRSTYSDCGSNQLGVLVKGVTPQVVRPVRFESVRTARALLKIR